MVDLSGLRDIHIPVAPSWWPPAVGWWIVMGGVLTGLITGLIMFRGWYGNPRQYALRELKKTYERTPNVVLLARQISVLLKRVVLVQYPRTKVATLTDEKWVDFLVQKTGNIFSNSQLDLLAQATYMPEQNVPTDDPANLYQATRLAIIKLFEGKHHGRKSKKSS